MKEELFQAATRDGDTGTVRTLLSTVGTLSLIYTQATSGTTPLSCVTHNMVMSPTEKSIEGNCNNGVTLLLLKVNVTATFNP